MSGRGTMVSQCEANLWRMFTSNFKEGHFIQESKLFVSGHFNLRLRWAPIKLLSRRSKGIGRSSNVKTSVFIQINEDFPSSKNHQAKSSSCDRGRKYKVLFSTPPRNSRHNFFNSQISAWHLPQYLVAFPNHILWHLYTKFFSFFGCFSTSTQVFCPTLSIDFRLIKAHQKT